MSATGNVRARVRATLAERVRAVPAIAGVQVVGHLTPDIANEHILFGEITGAYALRNMKAGRKQRSDTFTQRVFVMAGRAGQTAAGAEERALELFAALDDVLADDPTLGVAGVQWARLGNVNGPDVAASDEGQVAFMEIEVDVLAHMI